MLLSWNQVPDEVARACQQHMKVAFALTSTYPDKSDEWYVNDPNLGKLTFRSTHARPLADPLWGEPKRPGDRSELAPVADLAAAMQRPFGGPNVLTNAIVMGTIGSALGYGGGWLAEQFMPEEYFQKKRLRKVTGALGGIAGAALPLIAMPWYKKAEQEPLFDQMASVTGATFVPDIRIDEWRKTVERDMYLEPQEKAVAVGLPTGASMVNRSPWVSPYDVARVAAGAGWGGMLGYGIGRVAQLVTGMTPKGVQAVQQAGILAGALKSVMPMMR
jgi:hypothetical protein